MGRRAKDVDFIGSHLAEIRRFREKSQIDLAAEIGVSREMIRQYESGQKHPSREVLLRIAGVLQMPMTYFTEHLWEIPGHETPVFFRRQKKTPAPVRDGLMVYHRWLENIFAFLETYIQFPEFPGLWTVCEADPRDAVEPDDIEDYANHTRLRWNLGLGPISNVMLLLEKYGVIIGSSPTHHQTIDACSRRKGPRGLILLTLSKTAVRHRFDVAHELGHLVLHHQVTYDDLLADPGGFDRWEKEANRFASAFLMPQESFVREFSSTNPQSLIRLKSRWKVSMQALVERAFSLQLIDDTDRQRFHQTMRQKGWNFREPLDDEIPSEVPTMLAKAVNLLFRQGILSKEDLLRQLPLPRRDVFRLIGVEDSQWAEPPLPLSVVSRSPNRIMKRGGKTR